MKLFVEKLDRFIPGIKIYESINREDSISFFLDSSSSFQKSGRFSFIGIDPFLIFKSKDRKTEIEHISTERVSKKEVIYGNPFDGLKKLLTEYKLTSYYDNNPIPFSGGAVGYFSYDLAKFLEKVPSNAIDDVYLPECFLGFYDVVLCFDNINKKVYISSFNYNGKYTVEKVKLLKDRIKQINYRKKSNLKVKTLIEELSYNCTKEKYINDILKIKEYIKAGDVYQVNLSQRFSAKFQDVNSLELYKNLRKINPAPFSAFLNFNNFQVLSSSPERFLKIENGIIETKPIKGTRPRGKTVSEDRKYAKELIESIKDKAEHIMIVDLERNDLGRVCEYASVRVKELYTLEKYASVFHLVSTVTGKLLKNKDVVDVLKACFPGGSITGAPKIRAIEIIDELEPTKRGIYTGSIGYIGFNGNVDLNIVIRTLILKDKKAYFQLGGGIVIDSDPENEYNETIDKGKAFFKILGR